MDRGIWLKYKLRGGAAMLLKVPILCAALILAPWGLESAEDVAGQEPAKITEEQTAETRRMVERLMAALCAADDRYCDSSGGSELSEINGQVIHH